jgi:DNA polymerase-3 subunit gamma/tau
MAGPIRARTYEAESAAAAARKFEADAAEAAEHGWKPASQVWEGSTLTVVYQSEDGAPPAEPAATQPAKPAEPKPEEPAKPEPKEPAPSDVARAYYGGKIPAADASTAAVEAKRAAPAAASVRASGDANPRRPTPFVPGKLAGDAQSPTAKATHAVPIDKTQANIGGGVIAEVGIGLWLIMAGAVVAVIGAVIAASAPRAD